MPPEPSAPAAASGEEMGRPLRPPSVSAPGEGDAAPGSGCTRPPPSREVPAAKRPALAGGPGGGTPQPTGERPPWLRTVPNAGKGDCVPLALSQAIAAQGEPPPTAHRLRAQIVGALTRNAAVYAPLWDGKSALEAATDARPPDFRGYAATMAGPGTWMGHLELYAGAVLLQRPIIKYALGQHPIVFNRKAGGTPVRLWYEDAHYEWIPTAPPESDLDTALAGDYHGGRGGGLGHLQPQGETRPSPWRRRLGQRGQRRSPRGEAGAGSSGRPRRTGGGPGAAARRF